MLHRVLKRAGLEKVRFHALRHTFATMALQNGVDVKTLSGLLGHYSAGFTLDTYGHITPAMKQDAAEKVGSFLSAALLPLPLPSPVWVTVWVSPNQHPRKSSEKQQNRPETHVSGLFLARRKRFELLTFWSVAAVRA